MKAVGSLKTKVGARGLCKAPWKGETCETGHYDFGDECYLIHHFVVHSHSLRSQDLRSFSREMVNIKTKMGARGLCKAPWKGEPAKLDTIILEMSATSSTTSWSPFSREKVNIKTKMGARGLEPPNLTDCRV